MHFFFPSRQKQLQQYHLVFNCVKLAVASFRIFSGQWHLLFLTFLVNNIFSRALNNFCIYIESLLTKTLPTLGLKKTECAPENETPPYICI